MLGADSEASQILATVFQTESWSVLYVDVESSSECIYNEVLI